VKFYNTTIGMRIIQNTDDHLESAFLFQRLSVLIQRYNAVGLGYLRPHNPRGRNIAVPTFVLVSGLVFSRLVRSGSISKANNDNDYTCNNDDDDDDDDDDNNNNNREGKELFCFRELRR